MTSLYPINLNIQGRHCLVVGGGAVAARKITTLLGCGAKVRVVSPIAVPEIRQLAAAEKIEWLERAYTGGDIGDSFMVFAATNQPAVQKRVTADAKLSGVLLNVASDPDASDFHVPASVRRGLLLLTISTGGGSPAFAKKLRTQMESEFGPEYTIILDLFARIREVVVADGRSQEDHQHLFHELIRSDIVEYIKVGDWQSVYMLLQNLLPPGQDISALLEDL